jgi:hypothetical protein
MKFGARMLIAGASEFERHHPLTDSFAAFYGMSEEQVDEIWKIGAQL